MTEGGTARKTVRQVALGGLGIAAVTLVCYRLHSVLTIPAFLYLLIVVLQSPAGGFASSLIVSLGATVCLDYFFTAPVLQLEIASPVDAVALVTYLLTSLVITRLASEARLKARAAERKQEAFARLYDTSFRLFSIPPPAVSGSGALQIFREVLEVEGVCLFDGEAGKMETAGGTSASLQEKTRKAYELDRDYEDGPSRTWIRSLRIAGRRMGAIGFQGLSDGESMAGPLSMLAGAALERAMSFQFASAAAATSQAETLRSAIVDAFAHQFKTPLAAILTAAGGIRETRELTPHQLEMIEMIETETLRLSRLATRLLVTARLDREEVQPRLEPTNLADLVARIIEQCPAEAHGVAMDSDPGAIEVASDQELLTLALTQLLDNAFKYSTPGSTVQIELGSRDGEAYVRVKSQGGFVEAGEREQIFDRFYRGLAARSLTPGAGLGLYVARKIANAHAGGLELEESRPGAEETTFCLRLPILKAEPQNVSETS